MKFLLDESADFRLGRYLSDLGHDVTAISRDYPQSLDDLEVLALAVEEERVLITRDRDFGELVFRLRRPHQGVILFRLGIADFQNTARWMDDVIARHLIHPRCFVVVTERGIRVRSFPGS